jgi:hypothetical protein
MIDVALGGDVPSLKFLTGQVHDQLILRMSLMVHGHGWQLYLVHRRVDA